MRVTNVVSFSVGFEKSFKRVNYAHNLFLALTQQLTFRFAYEWFRWKQKAPLKPRRKTVSKRISTKTVQEASC